TLEEISDFLKLTPSGAEDDAAEELRERAALTVEAIHCSAHAEEDSAVALLRSVDRDGATAYEPTEVGRIAHAHGIGLPTCRILHSWLIDQAAAPPAAWDVLDVLALVLNTPDGQRGMPFRPHRRQWDYVRDEYFLHLRAAQAHLGEDW